MQTHFFTRTLRTGIACAVVLLTGCAAVGPDYKAPAAQTPARWQAPVPAGNNSAALQQWWEQFNDTALTRLQQAAEADSPTLTMAWAKIEQARATLATARAGGRPQLTGKASSIASGSNSSSAQTTNTLTLDASWELDVWGRVQRTSQAASARVEARQGDWHDARVSLAAEVADDYVQYRSCVLLVQAYEQELSSTRETQRATEALVRAGLSATSDGELTKASVASTMSSLLAQKQECELLVKTLVNLTNLQETDLRALLKDGKQDVPKPAAIAIDKVPADTVRQRPDVVALERELAATTYEIGTAQADLLPTLSLSGVLTAVPSLTTWTFGPALSTALFDGGSGRAAVDSAKAGYVYAYANWQQSVRTAVLQVEQALVRLDSTGAQTQEAERSATAYRNYFLATEAQWRAGSSTLLTLEEARRQALSAEVSRIGLERDSVRYWIALYKALGGGWITSASVATPNTIPAP